MRNDEFFPMINEYIQEIIQKGSSENPIWNQEIIRQKRSPYWNYIDGTMMTALMRLFESTGENKYLRFCDDFIDHYVNEDGSLLKYSKKEYNLDNIKEGSVLFKLYDYTGKGKYRKAMDTLYSQLMDQPRTIEGNFWHKNIYPGQIWLDGLYMAQPFYLEYERRYNNKKGYGDIFNQFKNVVQLLKNPDTGLYYHGYDSTRTMYWANPDTGLSPHYWLRALGWFLMALVDLLEILDDRDDIEFYTFIRSTFTNLIHVLIQFQHESGMWYQIVDRGKNPLNYLETSGSSIIAYALLKAVSLKILPEGMAEYGQKAFRGICEKYLNRDADGKMKLGGTCLMAGLGGVGKRDGSFEYYMSEPVVENEAKGIAPFLLAYIYYKDLNSSQSVTPFKSWLQNKNP